MRTVWEMSDINAEYAEAYFDECQVLKAEIERLQAALGQTKQTLIDVQRYGKAEIDKLRAVLAKARPYVEHCAEPGGSDAATLVLREIDALAVGLMRSGTVHE